MARTKQKPAPSHQVTASGWTSGWTFRASGSCPPPFTVQTASNAVLTGAGTVLSISPAPGRWHLYTQCLRDLGDQADAEQLANDWHRVGADLYRALDHELAMAPDAVIATLYDLLSSPEAREAAEREWDIVRELAQAIRRRSEPPWRSLRSLLRTLEHSTTTD